MSVQVTLSAEFKGSYQSSFFGGGSFATYKWNTKVVALSSFPEFSASLRPCYAIYCLMARIYTSLVKLCLKNHYLKRPYSELLQQHSFSKKEAAKKQNFMIKVCDDDAGK